MVEQSKKYELNKEDMTKVGKGALIAGAGAILVYLAEVIPGIDFGVYTPIAVAIFGIGANLVRKWIINNKKR